MFDVNVKGELAHLAVLGPCFITGVEGKRKLHWQYMLEGKDEEVAAIGGLLTTI